MIDPPRAAFLDQAVAGMPAAWPLPPQHARRVIARWLDEALDRIDDELFARRFATTCPVPGQPPAAYQHRLLTEPSSAPTLLAGIRFKGGDLAWPFVELMAWDRPVVGHRAWGRVRDRLATAFAPFAPRHLRVRWPAGGRPPLPPGDLEPDLRLVAERLASLRGRPRPWGEEALDVRVAGDLDFFDAYVAAHAAWRAQAGPLGAEVFPERRADLAHCLETGAVVCVFHGERWAGVMAAGRGADRALDGYCVHEILLDTPVRGRRRAAILQRRLVDLLPDTGRDCLWGTIHHHNQPSLRTAARCGRRVVETSWFVRLG